jgi:hypothetical protein
MSIRLISEARNLKLEAKEKFILMLMADHANDEGTHCFPSIRRLEHDSGYSKNTVMAIIGKLKKKGIVELVQKGNQTMPNQYHIDTSKGEKLPKFEPSKWSRQGATPNSGPATASPIKEGEQVQSEGGASPIALRQNHQRTISKEPSVEQEQTSDDPFDIVRQAQEQEQTEPSVKASPTAGQLSAEVWPPPEIILRTLPKPVPLDENHPVVGGYIEQFTKLRLSDAQLGKLSASPSKFRAEAAKRILAKRVENQSASSTASGYL